MHKLKNIFFGTTKSTHHLHKLLHNIAQNILHIKTLFKNELFPAGSTAATRG